MASRSQSVAALGHRNSISLEKIDARVFCLGTEGGNPVTIFASPQPLSGFLQQKLAKTCDWESVIVCTKISSSSSSKMPSPTMAFFMPSGEEVSFCAHAAIGGTIAMGGGVSETWNFEAAMTGEDFTIETMEVEEVGSNENTENGGSESGSSSRRCCRLHMKQVRFDETPLGSAGMSVLEESSDRFGWAMAPSSETDVSAPPRNVSVARPKTLVELVSVDAVHNAGTPPSDGSFAQTCVTLDDSTGVYLYAPKPMKISESTTTQGRRHSVVSYECRQFPRSSGYPEDPATGIAAAALAASLRFGGGSIELEGGTATSPENDHEPSIAYDIYQGTAMGRPSLIQVMNLEKEDGSRLLSFGLQGRVEIDETCTIHVSE